MMKVSVFKAYTKLETVFSINENRYAIKHKLNYEITKDTKRDFRHMQTDNVRISKRATKRHLPWQLKVGKIKKKYPKIDQRYAKAK